MKGSYLLLAAVLYPMLGALAAYLIEHRLDSKQGKQANAGNYAVWFILLTELLLFLVLAVGYYRIERVSGLMVSDFEWEGFCGLGISFTLDGFRAVHGVLACFMWLVAGIFAKDYMAQEKNRARYHLFTLLTLGATLGVFLSADLYTTFIFFEIMSFTSFVWVAQTETKEALAAARTYLAIAVAGGLVMLMGLFLLYAKTKTLQIDQIMAACDRVPDKGMLYAAGCCMLFGFGAKAGLFGLHVWMPESYGHAPAPASALLSGMLSKTGLYGIIIVTGNLFFRNTGWGILVTICGLLTMAAGAVLALFSVELKRTLAFSSMSQIGFMTVGIGMVGMLGSQGTLAARGTALHMINHSLIKLVLFILCGVIWMNTGSLELNRVRGYGRKKPLLKTLFLVPALGISGIPLLNGYISKTLLHESILEAMEAGLVGGSFLQITESIFLISGGFTLAYMGKIFVAVFVEKNEDDLLQSQYDQNVPYLARNSAFLLSISCLAMVVIGSLPHLVTDRVADWCQSLFYVEKLPEKISYFSYANLKGGIVSILIGVVIYATIVRICMKREDGSYGDAWPKWWNTERILYKPLLLHILPAVFGVLCRLADSVTDAVVVLLRKTLLRDEKLPFEIEEGTIITYELGGLMDHIAAIRCKLAGNQAGEQTDYRHRLAVKYEEIREDRFIIVRSLSFGLLLFCVGLCFTLIYVLLQ